MIFRAIHCFSSQYSKPGAPEWGARDDSREEKKILGHLFMFILRLPFQIYVSVHAANIHIRTTKHVFTSQIDLNTGNVNQYFLRLSDPESAETLGKGSAIYPRLFSPFLVNFLRTSPTSAAGCVLLQKQNCLEVL